MNRESHPLAGDSPGARRELVLLRYAGLGQGPTVYLQAGLHADEMPGVLVLQHLLPLLDRAEALGRITGEIRVVPAANPLGLGQWLFQRPQGRQDLDSLHNFNRGFAGLAAEVAEVVAPLLTASEDENRKVIRAAMRDATARLRAAARTDMAEMQAALLHWSCDADHVLDLHCDHVAVMHLYASTARPEITSLLARAVGAKLALIQDVSGGNAFDEAHTVPWRLLRDRFGGQYPIPAATFSTTLEYRGQFDVEDATAAEDARNLMDFLAAIGAVAAPDAALRHDDALHLPLGGAAEVFAPQGGVVTWQARPGDRVEAGAVLAHVTDPMTRRRLAVTAPVAGMMFRHELWRSCLRGQSLAHVAGENVLRHGDLLSD